LKNIGLLTGVSAMIEFYDRTAYWLFVLEIPHIRGKELMSAVKFKLSSLYPGNVSECNIHIRKNGAKKWSYLVFVLDKNTGHSMLPLSPLFVQYIYAQKTADVLYAGSQWLDYVRIEDGAILSSAVKIRNEDTLQDDVKSLCGKETDLIIYCDNSDKELFSQFQENNNIQFFDSHAELKKIDAHKISLFSGKSPAVKRLRFFAAAVVLFFLGAGSWLLYQYRESEKERGARLRLEQEQQQKAAAERQMENQRLLQLKLQYHEITASKTAAPFDIAAVIAECSEQQTRIQSATFNGGFFQIEGITGNSLDLLRKFENHRLVSGARLHQVHPDGNRDTFTLSGTVQTEAVSIDESLPADRQIEILENLIAAEKNYASAETQLSPSAFGESVKDLFSKWGCVTNSYQFMNDSQETEVEYSLRGPGNGFFNALYEIKTKHRLWDVRLTQIRNLYPRNMLDVVVSVRTEYHLPKTGGIEAPPPETVSPYPVSNISRNYFAPAPSARTSAEPAVAREQTPQVPAAGRAERVTWLEYVGSINDDNNNRFIYVKNTRTGEILKLELLNEGNMRYAAGPSGSITVYIDGQAYEINRR
jgi:hypothetical protein